MAAFKIVIGTEDCWYHGPRPSTDRGYCYCGRRLMRPVISVIFDSASGSLGATAAQWENSAWRAKLADEIRDAVLVN